MPEPQSHGAAVIARPFYPATYFNEIYRNLISLRPLFLLSNWVEIGQRAQKLQKGKERVRQTDRDCVIA